MQSDNEGQFQMQFLTYCNQNITTLTDELAYLK